MIIYLIGYIGAFIISILYTHSISDVKLSDLLFIALASIGSYATMLIGLIVIIAEYCDFIIWKHRRLNLFKKRNISLKNILMINSFKAGILIGFGCIVYILISNHILGAALFSLGLLTICIKKLWLYTGRIGSITYNDKLVTYLIGFLFNAIGIISICWLFKSYSGLDFNSINSMMHNKLNATLIEILFKSIGCGVMMEIAVSNYKKNNHPLTIIMPVMIFILCGFEHCIADIGYMALYGTFYPKFILITIVGNSIGSLLISKL